MIEDATPATCSCKTLEPGQSAYCPVRKLMMSAALQRRCTDHLNHVPTKQDTAAKPGCCGQKPSIGKQLASAASSLMRFIGDGCKAADKAEQAIRADLCDTCPLNSNGRCMACGCYVVAKHAARLEHCPTYRWQPSVRPVRPLEGCTRNLIMHLWPVEDNDIWRRHLQVLATNQELFSGQRIISVALSGPSVVKRGRVIHADRPTESMKTVVDYAKSIGLLAEFRPVLNDPSRGEVVAFRSLLEAVQTNDPNDVTYYVHSKGAQHGSGNKSVNQWRDVMYEVLLDWPSVQHALERFSIAGSFRRYAGLGTPWHYSGTFFAFRTADLFAKSNWGDVQQIYHGVEAWPGRVFSIEESACLFADGVRGESTLSPYEPIAWEQQINPLLEQWRKSRCILK